MQKPLLKWAGNKYRVLPHLLPIIGTPKTYVEPFGGTLATALNVTADEYRLGDINADLINLYQRIKSDNNFVEDLKSLFSGGNDEERYYQLREEFNESHDPLLFVYLNRHCFNGLTRYNKSGKFNVPFGRYKKVYIPENEIDAFKTVFRDVTFKNSSFNDMSYYDGLGQDDVVYFDPPYFPATETANFTDYAKEGFTLEQQQELADIAIDLASTGVKVLISNHDVPIAREMYVGAKFYEIQVTRSISAKGTSRKKASELIAVWNNECYSKKETLTHDETPRGSRHYRNRARLACSRILSYF